MQVSFTGIDYYLIASNMTSSDKSAVELIAAVNNEGKKDALELNNFGALSKNNTLQMEVSNNSQNLTINGKELRADFTNTSKIERLQEFFKDLVKHEQTHPDRYLGSITDFAGTKEMMKSKSELRINKINMFSQALSSIAEKIRIRLN